PREALADINAVLEKGDDKLLLSMQGIIYSQLGEHEKAQKTYRELIDQAEKETWLGALLKNEQELALFYNNLAWSQLASGRLEEAEKSISKSLNYDDTQFPALDTRGVLYYLQGKPEKAVSVLTRAASLSPD